MEEDILMELLSIVDVRLTEGVMDLKAFRSIGIMGTIWSGVGRSRREGNFFGKCLKMTRWCDYREGVIKVRYRREGGRMADE